MQDVRTSLPFRSDTMFGICEALGQDFGINANWFRVVFATGVVFNLEYALAAYFGVGLLVLASRLIFRTRAAIDPAVVMGVPTVIEAPVAKPVAERPVLAEAA